MSARENPFMRRYREASERGDRETFGRIVRMSQDKRDFRRLHTAYIKEPRVFREVLETALNSSTYTERDWINFALNETGENREVYGQTAKIFLAWSSVPLGTYFTNAFLNSGSKVVGLAAGFIAMGTIGYFVFGVLFQKHKRCVRNIFY